MTPSKVAPSELYIVSPPHRSGAWTAFIQTRMLFWLPVSHQSFEPAGITNDFGTGTTIGEPAASGPCALPQCTGTRMFPVTFTVTGTFVVWVSLMCQPPFTHAPVWNFKAPSIEPLYFRGLPPGVSTQCLSALSPLAWPGAGWPVVRTSARPPTETVVVACIVSSPTLEEVVSTLQVPRPLETVQLSLPVNVPTWAP